MKKFAFAFVLALAAVALLAPPQAWAQDDKPFTIHGEVRFRGEYSNNTYDFSDNSAPDEEDGAGYWPYRVRIAAEGHFSDNVTGWIELQNTGLFGEYGLFEFAGGDITNARRFNDMRSMTQLYQAYIDLGKVWGDHFSLRFGRQEMVFGNEFIFGDEDFYTGISHDGISGTWDYDKWDLTVWYMRTVEDSVYQFGFVGGGAQDVPPDYVFINPYADNIEHLGGYLTWNVTDGQVVDVYLFNVNDRGWGGRWQTLGARYARDGWDKGMFVWNVEIAQQFGSVASETVVGVDVDASGMGFEGMIGYNFKGGDNVHRVYAKYEMATGDDNTTDDDYEGFVNHFGEFHNRAGHGDWFRVDVVPTGLGGTGYEGGLASWAVGYTGMYNERHEFGAEYWDHSLEEDNDSSFGDELGQEFDLWYGFNYTKNVSFMASYSNLSPGDALTFGGPDDSVERLYGQVRLRF